jgi:hypothetical protein
MASSNGPMNSPFEQVPKVVNKKNYYTFVSPLFLYPNTSSICLLRAHETAVLSDFLYPFRVIVCYLFHVT